MSCDLVVRPTALRLPEGPPRPRLARGTIAPAIGTTAAQPAPHSPRIQRVRIEPDVIDDAEVIASVAILHSAESQESIDVFSKRDVQLFAAPLEGPRARRVTAAYAAAAPVFPRPIISVC